MEHVNDPRTTVIGRNTVSGSRAKSKGPLTVEVSVNGTFVRPMPLKELVRFSKVAAAAFPRPEPSDKAANVGAAQSSEMKLNLHLPTLYRQPPPGAVKFAFRWMDNAKLTIHGPPPDYGATEPESHSLEELVNVYAAALLLDLRPDCRTLRSTLRNRITERRPTLAALRYVHEHLPINDVVMTRFITSYFEHRDKGDYTREEQDEIELKCVCVVDPELHKRFKDIGNSRKARSNPRRRPPRRIAEGRMQETAHVEAGGTQLVDAEDRVARGLTAGGRSSGRGRRR